MDNTAQSEDADRVRRELAAIDREYRKTKERLREVEAELEASQVHVRNLTAMLHATTSRRSVRYLLAGVEKIEPARRVLGQLRRGTSSRRSATPIEHAAPETLLMEHTSASEADEAELVAQLLDDRRGLDHATTGPLVTIVIVTRDGIHHMRRVLDGLANRTEYSSFEVVVVDNHSTDGTVALCQQSWPFEIRVIENDNNQSFSYANNQGIAQANGEYVLFLNNDVDPIYPGWLAALVAALESEPERGAAGALLIYPRPTDPSVVRNHAMPLTVQHRGIRFRQEDGSPKGYNVGRGEDPLATSATDVTSVPGVTAACKLVRSSVLAEVSGYTEGYVYGTEDVDLSLKIRNAGYDIVNVAAAALFHYEFGTQDEVDQRVTQINRAGNRTLFLETWGPTLERLMAPERLGLERFWSAPGTPTVAITRPKDDEVVRWDDYHTANELGETFAGLGWNVVFAEELADRWYEMDPATDLVVCLHPSCDIRKLPPLPKTIAWVRHSVERWIQQPWFDEYDVVASPSETSRNRIGGGSRHQAVAVPVAANVERFAPQPFNVSYESDIAFTGPHWGANRALIDRLIIRPDEKFVIFGKGWHVAPHAQRYWRGPSPYDDLPTIYSSAKIVLDTAIDADPTHGLLNSRVVNALASGALVITDDIVGSAEHFDGKLPTYASAEELREQLDTYLGDDSLRAQLCDELREQVQANHSFPKLAGHLVASAMESTKNIRLRLKIAAPNWDVAEKWGDTHFARHFGAALAKHGFSTDIDVLADWDAPESQDCEVAVHLRGLVPYVPKAGQVNVLWVISHPEDVSGAECDAFDLVLVASPTFAARLQQQTATPVKVLMQATSPRIFHPHDVQPDLATDLLFVGNSRSVLRPAVEMAIQAQLPLRIYGSGWSDLVPAEYIVDEYFPNERLAELYSSAKLLLNDHWEDMRDAGFLSNRLFDAMAAGTVVITDSVVGLDAVFPTSLPQFSDANSLGELVRAHLSDDSLRRRIAEEGRAAVLANHTFEHRASEFEEMVRPLIAAKRSEIRLEERVSE